MLFAWIKKTLYNWLRRCLHERHFRDNLDYWQFRANRYGARSVLNLAHPATAIESVTQMQIKEIFPYLRKHLTGNEQKALDFGCGVGRFTAPLAQLIGGHATGADPIQTLLDHAPQHPDTTYVQIVNGHLPCESASFDLVWIALVLGGIKEEDMETSIAEIDRSLKPNGLICLAENITLQPDATYWYFRNDAYYLSLFKGYHLQKVHTYTDADDTIAVFIGRKPA